MNTDERHQARVSILAAHIVNPMPWVFHEGSLWNETTKEWLEAADAAEPGEVADDDWPSTVHGSDFEPVMGAFIAEATVGYPAALDAIDRVLALHPPVVIHRLVCGICDEGGRRPDYPCATVKAIEGAS